MKKLLIAVFIAGQALCASVSFADTTTSRLGLTIPTIGSASWGQKINQNFRIIDATVTSNAFLAAITQTWTGQQTFSSPLPSTFTYGVAVGSMNVTGATMTLNGNSIVASASSQVYTIPNVGASANFVMAQTTQAITEDLLGSITASSSSVVSFTGLSGSKYSEYKLIIDRLIPAVSTTNIKCQLSTGSGFLATGYTFANFTINTSATAQTGSINGTSWIVSGSSLTAGAVSNQSISGEIYFLSPDNVSAVKFANWHMAGIFTGNTFASITGSGQVGTNSAVIDGIQISMDNYNLSGKFRLYGTRNAQ